MGRQIRFYFYKNDEERFLEFLFSNTNVVLVKEKSYISKIETVGKSILSVETKNPHVILIWNTKFAIRPEIYRQDVEREYCVNSGKYELTERSFYSLNKLYGPFIEYVRSTIREDNSLSKGRVWADMYYLENDKFIHKGEEFENFYEQISRWLRNNLNKIRGIDGYIGNEALDLYMQGKISLQN